MNKNVRGWLASAWAMAILATVALAALPARGQVIRVDSTPSSLPAEGPKVLLLTVSSAPQPEPALRYLLLPELSETTPGNAALLYHVAMELAPTLRDGNMAERIAEWLDVPSERLPRKEVEEAISLYGTCLRQLELAARREKCDWDLPIRSEGIGTIMPPLSTYRQLARVLALRVRLHIAEGRYDDAVHDLQTGYAMARHVSEGPTLIESLVGIAAADLMNQATMELVQIKGGPNLYWAVANLPRPFIGLKRAFDYERGLFLFGADAGLLRKAAYGQPLTDQEAADLPGELRKTWESVFQDVYWQEGGKEPTRRQLALTAAAIKIYPHAKKELAKGRYTAEQVEKMPVAQVVTMFTLGRYLHWRDEMTKWQALPWPQGAQGLAKAAKALEAAVRKPEEGWPFIIMMPSVARAGFIGGRLDRKLGVMMTIEAVRLYASAHEGKAPASLDELTDSPALPDPITGKAFQYRRTEDGFVISCPVPSFKDLSLSAQDEEVYKVTLRN